MPSNQAVRAMKNSQVPLALNCFITNSRDSG
jgi:hypothetical protein